MKHLKSVIHGGLIGLVFGLVFLLPYLLVVVIGKSYEGTLSDLSYLIFILAWIPASKIVEFVPILLKSGEGTNPFPVMVFLFLMFYMLCGMLYGIARSLFIELFPIISKLAKR